MRQPQIKFTFTLCAALALTLIESASGEQFSDWSPPVSLGPIINTEFDDSGAFISRDGLRLYFNSNRPGGFGGLDIYVSKRALYVIHGGSRRTSDRRSIVRATIRRRRSLPTAATSQATAPGDSAVLTSTSLPGGTSVTTLPGDLRKTSAAQ